MYNIQTITVIGANGTIGSQIVKLLGVKTSAKVFLVCRTKKKAIQTIKRITSFMDDTPLLGVLVPCDYSELGQCVAKSDWVFESVAEDLSVKLDINRQIDSYLGPDTIVSTGTSSFSIELLASSFQEATRTHYFGTHFFNPPDKLPLLEFVNTKWSDPDSSLGFYRYLRETLDRQSVTTNDVPAFLANRIGVLFLNEVAQLAEEYSDRGGIDYLDAIMGTHTGRMLAPLKTIDYIGIDVFEAIVKNLDGAGEPCFKSLYIPQFLNQLLSKRYLGRKCGIGLYKMEVVPDGSKTKLVYDIKRKTYRPLQKYNIPFVEAMTNHLKHGRIKESFAILMADLSDEAVICRYLLVRYIVVSYLVALEAADRLSSADLAMEYGYGWIPPRKLVSLLGGYAGLEMILLKDKRLRQSLEGFDLALLKYFCQEVTEDDMRFFRIS